MSFSLNIIFCIIDVCYPSLEGFGAHINFRHKPHMRNLLKASKMATPAKVTKPEGKNNHEAADEQAGNDIGNSRANLQYTVRV